MGSRYLCESGPCLDGTLLHNDSQRFICDNVYLRAETSNSLVTQSIGKGDVLENSNCSRRRVSFLHQSDTLDRLTEE